tara:strand:+ start:1001 stop:1108 length:108 start_codon:yes stop_codon:yes gene_type:complete
MKEDKKKPEGTLAGGIIALLGGGVMIYYCIKLLFI